VGHREGSDERGELALEFGDALVESLDLEGKGAHTAGGGMLTENVAPSPGAISTLPARVSLVCSPRRALG